MDKFWTCFLIGLSWIIMGLFHYLQSNNSKILRALRTKTIWICFRSIFVMFFCVVGAYIEVSRSDPSRENNKFVVIWLALFSSGVIEFCHINNYLQESFWAFVGPFAFLFSIVLQSLEEEPLLFWKMLTMISSVLIIPLVFLTIAINLARHRAYIKAMKGGGKKAKGIQASYNKEELNPIYTEQSVYESLLPGFTAFLMVLQGIIWWEMSFRSQYIANTVLSEAVSVDMGHAAHGILAQLISDIFLAVCFLSFFSISLKIIDRVLPKNLNLSSDSSLDTSSVLYTGSHTHKS